MAPFRPFVLLLAIATAGQVLTAQDGPRAAARATCADLLRRSRIEPETKPAEAVLQAVFEAKHLGPQPGSVAAVRAALATGDALVEFVQWPDLDGERVTAFVLRPQGPIVRVELGSAADLQQAVAAHVRLLARWQQPLDATSKRLGDGTSQRVRRMVLAALEPALASCQRVWFAADGALLPLPFEALPAATAGTFLLEAIDVRQLHCGTDLLLDCTNCSRDLLVVDGGSTDLPEASREARAIARVWEGVGEGPVRMRRASAPEPLDDALDRRGFVHFATRGEFVRNGGKMPATVRIADASTSANVPFPANLAACRLVVVSNCDSGPGHTVPDRAPAELRRLLRVAGVRMAACPSWPVDDRSTREWMEQFWQGLRNETEPASVARTTKLAWLERHRRQSQDPMPGTWAAFTFVGR